MLAKQAADVCGTHFAGESAMQVPGAVKLD